MLNRGTAKGIDEVNLRHHPYGDSEYLLRLGVGRLSTEKANPYQGSIEVSTRPVLLKQDNIITTIFNNFDETEDTKGAILIHKNVNVLAVNEEIIHILRSENRTYHSIVS